MNNLKIYCENLESEAKDQIQALAAFSAYSDSRIRIMPDAHAGAGCTVGTTMTLNGKVTPNLVGVDIGCGMRVLELGKVQVKPADLENIITANIPSGMNIRTARITECEKAEVLVKSLHCYRESWPLDYFALSIGTLGGGNHFIELNHDEEGNCFLVIHSGSRHLGIMVCRHYQEKAEKHMASMADNRKEIIAQLKAEGREKDIQAILSKMPRPGKTETPLAYVEGSDFDQYLDDMDRCQRYAVLNRAATARIIVENLGLTPTAEWETIHNYIDVKNMILRKGSVSAREGERLIIPMNMRDGSLICTGKGNPDWNWSAPHGAGRLMSRSQAMDCIDLEEFRRDMQGIASWSVCDSTRDEAPGAYKPMESIIRQVAPTVTIEKIIRPVYNYKAH